MPVSLGADERRLDQARRHVIGGEGIHRAGAHQLGGTATLPEWLPPRTMFGRAGDHRHAARAGRLRRCHGHREFADADAVAHGSRRSLPRCGRHGWPAPRPARPRAPAARARFGARQFAHAARSARRCARSIDVLAMPLPAAQRGDSASRSAYWPTPGLWSIRLTMRTRVMSATGSTSAITSTAGISQRRCRKCSLFSRPVSASASRSATPSWKVLQPVLVEAEIAQAQRVQHGGHAGRGALRVVRQHGRARRPARVAAAAAPGVPDCRYAHRPRRG